MVSSAFESNPLSSTERLSRKAYDNRECSEAIQGKALPTNLGHSVMRQGTIRGIRHHPNFASSAEVLEICHAERGMFLRARNACLIINDIQPTLDAPDAYPYCIWYPRLASESTYRQLVQNYPKMRYQVGRACAVAGYTELYHELDLLPDVAIAEESRERGTGNRAIYDHIMAQPHRYAIMDDYTRTVETQYPRCPASLNADTMVRSYLDVRTKYPLHDRGLSRKHRYFADITEDGCIDIYTSERKVSKLSEEEAALLYSPLPFDLPTMNKDLLILMAAHNGDIDRYARLRRPTMIFAEWVCVVRGIYHSFVFAKWFSTQKACCQGDKTAKHFRKAINARFIMSDSLSSITESTPEDELPLMIWYPQVPSRYVLEELAIIKPSMKPQIALACIYAGYTSTYDKLEVRPERILYEAAKNSDSPYFRDDLERRATKLGVNPNHEHTRGSEESVGRMYRVQYELELYTELLDQGELLYDPKQWAGQGLDLPDGIYNGVQPNSYNIEAIIAKMPPPHDAWQANSSA